MPTSLPRQPFTAWRIAGIPARAGVYVLWQGEEILYVGRAHGAATMRSRLMEHYTRQVKPWDATHFSWEACERPAEREAAALREAQRALGCLPRYNGG